MPISNPKQLLLVHDRWATRNIIEACKPLSHDQFHQRFDMGPGSLHDTITHILGATRGWTDLLASRPQRDRLETEGPFTPDELTDLNESLHDDLDAAAKSHPDDETVTGERGGRSYSFKRGAVVTHVTTHAMHHRAQCLNMLRHLGVDPIPHTAVVEWMLFVDPVE